MEQQVERNYAEYDYLEVTAKNEQESIYRKNYPKFGWEEQSVADADFEMNAITLTFRRSRKIPNKSVLTRLQRQFETATKEIMMLEKKKTKSATVAACFISVIGAGILVGAAFSFLAKILLLAIVLTVLGCFTWTMAWLSFIYFKKRKTELCQILIFEQFNEIRVLTEQRPPVSASLPGNAPMG